MKVKETQAETYHFERKVEGGGGGGVGMEEKKKQEEMHGDWHQRWTTWMNAFAIEPRPPPVSTPVIISHQSPERIRIAGSFGRPQENFYLGVTSTKRLRPPFGRSVKAFIVFTST